MAFKSNNLSFLAYANGFSLWNYQTEGHVKELFEKNYFNKSLDELRIGDKLSCNTADGGIDIEVTGASDDKITIAVWGERAKAVLQDQSYLTKPRPLITP